MWKTLTAALLLLAALSCSASEGDSSDPEALAKVATDNKVSKGKRLSALASLAGLRSPKVAGILFEAAKFEPEFALRNALFNAAAASGSEEVTLAMASHYASHHAKPYRNGLRAALRNNLSGSKLFAWASAHFPDEEARQPWVADLIIDSKDSADRATVLALMEKAKHPMAYHRLARAAVELGAQDKIDVLIAGMKLGDENERSDAAALLAEVADRIPNDKKAAVIEVAKAAKSKGARGLASRGYDDLLSKLDAN